MAKIKGIFLVLLLILAIDCQAQKPKWDEHILSSILIPNDARKINYYTLEGSYQAAYEVRICYPVKDFIEVLVQYMVEHRWKRLDFDFLNPQQELHHARAPDGLWGSYYDGDGYYVNQWIEDFEDTTGNIVRYGLKYRTKPKSEEGKQKTFDDPCTLEVVAIYIPQAIRQK